MSPRAAGGTARIAFGTTKSTLPCRANWLLQAQRRGAVVVEILAPAEAAKIQPLVKRDGAEIIMAHFKSQRLPAVPMRVMFAGLQQGAPDALPAKRRIGRCDNC